MKAKRTAWTLIASSMLLASCCNIEISPAKALAEAVEHEHMDYVQNDPTLDADQKARRQRTWDAFRVWIKAVEER